MELINRIKKNRKGFTLVEIIVVLVILAILAAFTIPTMLGFVNDAKGKSYIAEAREVYVAAQSTATEFSAKTGIYDDVLATALGSQAVESQDTAPAALAATPTAAEIVTYNKALASHQMNKYIGTDLTISDTAVTGTITAGTFSKDESAWSVIVGTNSATGTTAQVRTLVYYKNGYQVTITDGNASVKKL